MGDESPDAGENNAHLEAPMAFVHDAADAFAGRAAYTRTLPVSELFELDPTDAGQNDTHKKQNIIKAVKDAHKSKYDIKSARHLLFASLLYEDSRRLLSKLKTVEDFIPYDLIRVDPETVPEGYRTEWIYGFPHAHLLIQ